MNELRGQPEPREAGETGPAYDTQKVETLKATLIKTLRHAANLRVRPQDRITVAVGRESVTRGSPQEPFRYLYSQHRGLFAPANSRTQPRPMWTPSPQAN
jgi:hypothetical protein